MNKIFILILLSFFPLVVCGQTCETTIPESTPTSAFVDNGDGTITDTRTSLMWKRCAEGQTWSANTCSGSARSYTWQAALQRAKTHNDAGGFAGKTDWRLPNIRELESITEDRCYAPAINTTLFPNTDAYSSFWSASANAYTSNLAWSVVFDGGYAGYGLKSGSRALRLARAGQFFTLFPFHVTKVGTGNGTVTSNPTGIHCGSNCTDDYSPKTNVTLTATPDSDSTFAGWSGDCSGNTNTCTVNMTAAKNVTATFTKITYLLTVNNIGAGSGTVSSNPAGINQCGATCVANFSIDTSIVLTATPATGATFSGWSGDCSGTGTCTVNMTAAKNVTANFGAGKSDQTIGDITLNPALIFGGSSTISAIASSGLTVSFSSSTPNICTISGNTVTGIAAGTCTIVANQIGDDNYNSASPRAQGFIINKADQSIDNFNFNPTTLSLGGNTTASATASSGLSVVFNSTTPNICTSGGINGSTITGIAAGTCTIVANQDGNANYNAAAQVTRNIAVDNLVNPVNYNNLTVIPSGTGNGIVISSPTGINCGLDCNENYPVDTYVTLTAIATNGSSFAGWSGGGCTGDTSCTVSMATAKGVIATFNTTFPLTIVNNLGTGSGTVISNPPGISCGSDCNENYASNTTVTLTAIVANGSVFAGWSGACQGNKDTCTVTMTEAKGISAMFQLAPYQLTVIKTGSGKGTVTSSVDGIQCGTDCKEYYAKNAAVTLKATPASGAIFGGWGGACKGTKNTCTLKIKASKDVVATFTALAPDFIITKIKLNPATPTADIRFTVQVTVKNEGTSPGNGAALRIWTDQPLNQKCGASGGAVKWDIGKLDAGKSQSFKIDFTDGVRPKATGEKKTIRAFIDSECDVNESNENNNQRTQTYNVRW